MKKFALITFLLISTLAANGDLKSWFHHNPTPVVASKPAQPLLVPSASPVGAKRTAMNDAKISGAQKKL